MKRSYSNIVRSILNKQSDLTEQLFADLIHTRKNQLAETIQQQLTEIRWSDPEVVRSALEANILCGFEAETVWTNIPEGSTEEDLYGMGFYDQEVQDLIRDQSGPGTTAQIENRYQQEITERDDFMDYHYRILRAEAENLAQDPDEVAEYIRSESYVEDNQEELEQYREERLEKLQRLIVAAQEVVDAQQADPQGEPRVVERYQARVETLKDQIEQLADTSDEELAIEYLQEDPDDIFMDWLEDRIRENDTEIYDQALERYQEDYSIDDWISEQYLSLPDFLGSEYDIYFTGSGGIEEVGTTLEDWARANSEFDEVEAGEYHSTGSSAASRDQDYWRVETDSSISTFGTGVGAEIISPVYDTPAQMLEEMQALFEWMSQNDVETNRSTGLHITMSMPGSPGKPNQVKMAVMLDDPYLLKQFDRLGNTYTQSQLRTLAQYAQGVSTGQVDNLEQLERLIAPGVKSEKFRAINFKDAVNTDGNQLIEFRIAGGADYLAQMDLIEKTLVRYATNMQLGYDADAYRREYATKLHRMLSRAADLDLTDDGDGQTSPGLQALIQAVKELSPTGRDAELIVHDIKVLAGGGQVDHRLFLSQIFTILSRALMYDQIKQQPTTRTARLLRTALAEYKITPLDISNEVVNRVDLRERKRTADALSTLLALPDLAAKLGLEVEQKTIEVPLSGSLLVRGRTLNSMLSQGKISDPSDLLILPTNIIEDLTVALVPDEQTDPEQLRQYQDRQQAIRARAHMNIIAQLPKPGNLYLDGWKLVDDNQVPDLMSWSDRYGRYAEFDGDDWYLLWARQPRELAHYGSQRLRVLQDLKAAGVDVRPGSA